MHSATMPKDLILLVCAKHSSESIHLQLQFSHIFSPVVDDSFSQFFPFLICIKIETFVADYAIASVTLPELHAFDDNFAIASLIAKVAISKLFHFSPTSFLSLPH
jgi:hypothetical protein